MQIQLRANGHEARRINGGMADVIMVLDVMHIDRLSHAFMLIEIKRVSPQVGVVCQATDIALEVPHVNRVEPDQRGKQAPVRKFIDFLAERFGDSPYWDEY
jgi:hypothetical protein